MSVSERKFGVLQTGETVKIFHLENKSGAYAEVTDFGAILVKVCVPDKDGTLTDVVLGYDDLASYEVNGCFFGSTIGRNGNRIGGAKFSVNGKEVVLAQNENDNNLHSGPDGFEKKLWKVAEISDDKNSVIFNRISPDGENGFPGEFDVSVKYEFTEDNELRIHYQGICDEPTVANMTNHSYFNLAGHASGTIDNQILQINSEFYTPNDSECMPTGEVLSVMGTPFDFRAPKPIGQDINADFEQIEMFGGYDHNFAISGRGYRLCAIAKCLENGITMEVYTDKPGVQLYTSNGLSEGIYKEGAKYSTHQAFCLETQYFPNGMKNSHFIAPILKVGDEYNFTTEYKFIVK